MQPKTIQVYNEKTGEVAIVNEGESLPGYVAEKPVEKSETVKVKREKSNASRGA